jgi:oligopeptidase B
MSDSTPSEMGDPTEEADYRYVLSFSPYQNVEAGDYPNMLVTAALRDTQVPYWAPAKWVAKLRAKKTDDNLLLLETNLGAGGHAGRSGRQERWREVAFIYSFILDLMGIEG